MFKRARKGKERGSLEVLVCPFNGWLYVMSHATNMMKVLMRGKPLSPSHNLLILPFLGMDLLRTTLLHLGFLQPRSVPPSLSAALICGAVVD